MNSIQLTEYLTSNPDEVLTVLHSLGYENIIHNTEKDELRFARDGGENPSSVRVKLDTLAYNCFSTNEKGNLYTLIMNNTGDRYFPNALNYVARILDLDKNEFNREIKLPFSGFYKQLIKEVQEPELIMETYDESILEPYLHKYNTMFFNDGINYQTQKKFKVGYDLETNRITIPEYTLDGKLCGIITRLNDVNADSSERWFPILPCSRSLTLYGYHQNYQKIQEKGLVIIGESNKFPQQLDSFKCYIGLATCGCNISPTQAKYVKGLLVPKVILAYDEGLEEDQVREEAYKLKIDNTIFSNNVGYIHDYDNKYLPKGSKASPSDFGKEVFYKLIKERVVWL